MKSEIVTEIAATMAFSATQNNDKIGLICFQTK
jgi:Mg-chelatase subunit ChlD